MARRATPNRRTARNMGVPVSAALMPALGKHAAKRGFRDARLIAEWATIVGSQLAAKTKPERLDRRGRNACLHLLVANGWGLEVQHLQPLIIDKINQFYGHEMVNRISMRQGPVKPHSTGSRTDQPSPPADIPPAQAEKLERACGAVTDPELAAILHRLGTAILQSR